MSEKNVLGIALSGGGSRAMARDGPGSPVRGAARVHRRCFHTVGRVGIRRGVDVFPHCGREDGEVSHRAGSHSATRICLSCANVASRVESCAASLQSYAPAGRSFRRSRRKSKTRGTAGASSPMLEYDRPQPRYARQVRSRRLLMPGSRRHDRTRLIPGDAALPEDARFCPVADPRHFLSRFHP